MTITNCVKYTLLNLFFFLNLLAATSVYAQKGQPKKNPQPQAATEKGALFFENTFVNLGNISDTKEPLTVVFKYRNIGKGPVKIEQVKVECHCSKAEWDKGEIRFNQEGKISVRFYPEKLSGKVTKNFTVFTNGEPSVYYLSLSAIIDDHNARMALSYQEQQGNLRFDSYQVGFDTVYLTEQDSAVRAMYNPTGKTMKIQHIKAPSHIQVKVDEMQIQAGLVTGIRFKYDPESAKDYGQRPDEVLVYTTDSLVPIKKFLIRANIQEDFRQLTPKEYKSRPVFQAVTPVVDLDSVKMQSTHVAAFTITNTGKSPMYVRKIYSTCGCTVIDFNYNQPIKKGKKAIIKVTYSTNYDLGEVSKKIIVITNTPDKTIHELELKANIIHRMP